MSLSSIKAMKAEKGFTIVELLIVIVVIGILAAIVIVSFNGVQQRANTTASKSAASTVQKKAEAYNALNATYPTSSGEFNAYPESALTNSGVSLGPDSGPSAVSSTNGKTTVVYYTCGTGGFRVKYWDYSNNRLSLPADSIHGGSTTGTTPDTSCTVRS